MEKLSSKNIFNVYNDFGFLKSFESFSDALNFKKELEKAYSKNPSSINKVVSIKTGSV